MRTDLATGTRLTIEALIVLDVHGKLTKETIKLYTTSYVTNYSFAARDVVKYLIDVNVENITEFDWISQLRYYWRETESKKL